MSKHYYSYLALGDSYTVGESVALHEGFPYQVVQVLRSAGIAMQGAEVVAKTGWTAFELAEHILHHQLNEHYDFVTLLIGVNDQYRERTVVDFAGDLDFLLKKAVHFTGGKPEQVIMLSIPDWGITPFGINSKRAGIDAEIDAFNEVCFATAMKQQAHFINITDALRSAKEDRDLLAADGLHYSAKAHEIWAGKVAGIILSQIHTEQPHG